ncbi:MAG: fructose-1,6-bisphosphatase [Nitrososphaerota archaeon]|nr:fructose-1,6-bisphosphatase [Nitrososphaerota archaeon]
MSILTDHLRAHAPGELSPIISAIATSSVMVRDALPTSRGMARGVNPSGERQAEADVYSNDVFCSSLLISGQVAEVASEEMNSAKQGNGSVHVAMDPLDGSSNISTNNPLGSIFGFYSAKLPCSGEYLIGAAYVTYGPMLTVTFSTGGAPQTFVCVNSKDSPEFHLLEADLQIPDKQEVFGLGGQRKEWIEPVERFVSSLEARGLKLRYGGTFVGDYNQVLHYGGIFGYPALKNKPKGKLRMLYEAAPMAYLTVRAKGRASDGSRDILSISPMSLAELTPLYLGTESLVKELEAMIAGR